MDDAWKGDPKLVSADAPHGLSPEKEAILAAVGKAAGYAGFGAPFHGRAHRMVNELAALGYVIQKEQR